ncbi:MAG: YciI-like protein [Bacteroidota bacterium]
MNYFVLIYDVVGDYLSRRTAYREEHLRLAREANHRGELLLAGAFSDPADRTLFIFHVQNKSAIEEFIHNDPYVINGLVTRWEIRPWTVVIGN